MTVAAGGLTYDIVTDGLTLLRPARATLDNGAVWGSAPRGQSLPHERRPVDRLALLPRRFDPRELQRPDAPHEGRMERGVPRLRRQRGLPLRKQRPQTPSSRERVRRIPLPSKISRLRSPTCDRARTVTGTASISIHSKTLYTVAPLSQLNLGRLAFLPLVVDAR